MSMDITLLKEEQIWGDKALQAMKSYGTKVGMSDLGILLGGVVTKGDNTTSDGQRAALVWSASSFGFGFVRAVNYDGDRFYYNPFIRYLGARPALPSSVASSIRLSDSSPEALAKGEAIRGEPIKDANGKVIWNDVILYGEYPQTIAEENITRELEQAFSRNQLQKTGKTYHFDSEKRDAYDKPFDFDNPDKALKCPEYQITDNKGKIHKYIRVEAKPFGEGYSTLSNGKTPQTGEVYWIQVQPIEWLRDPSGICVARQALFAGVQFDRNKKYDGNFEKTDMKKYLQNHFAKEMEAGRNVSVPAAIGPNTAAVLSGREAQRQEAANAPSWPL